MANSGNWRRLAAIHPGASLEDEHGGALLGEAVRGHATAYPRPDDNDIRRNLIGHFDSLRLFCPAPIAAVAIARWPQFIADEFVGKIGLKRKASRLVVFAHYAEIHALTTLRGSAASGECSSSRACCSFKGSILRRSISAASACTPSANCASSAIKALQSRAASSGFQGIMAAERFRYRKKCCARCGRVTRRGKRCWN